MPRGNIMNYNVDLSYNNATAREIMEDFAGWNDYFDIALTYAKHNNAPYDEALQYIIPIYFMSHERDNAYYKFLYLLTDHVYSAEHPDDEFPSYKDWCKINGYKVQE